MEQRKLYRTIDNFAGKHYSSLSEMFSDILSQLIENKEIDVTGGRIWQIDSDNLGYRLLFQAGSLKKIRKDYILKFKKYPALDLIMKERTTISGETDKTLIRSGILNYSATGVGPKVTVNGKKYYQYLLAVNSDSIDRNLKYTLNIVATVLTSRIKERIASETQKSINTDIDRAKQLQMSILPDHELKFHDYDLFGVSMPAEIIGGDFFDYLKIGDDEDRIGILLGDAASKGFPAAAEAMYISGALRMASSFQMKISPLMYRTNNLVNKIFSDDRFCSLFYGEISNDSKGLFLYANAGHNPPVYIKKNGKMQFLEPTGPLLGPAPNSRFDTDSINFEKGDCLVIYSDGIVEAANQDFEFYEEARLLDVIRNTSKLSAREMVYSILEDVLKFSTNQSKYQDDKTIVIIKRD